MRLRDADPDELLPRRPGGPPHGIHRTPAPTGYVLGPAPCHECHVPLYWAPYAGWRERRYVRDFRLKRRVKYVRQRNGQVRALPAEVKLSTQFEPHVCTARMAA